MCELHLPDPDYTTTSYNGWPGEKAWQEGGRTGGERWRSFQNALNISNLRRRHRDHICSCISAEWLRGCMNQKPTHKSIFTLGEGTHLDTVCSRDGTGCSGAGWTIKQVKFVDGRMIYNEEEIQIKVFHRFAEAEDSWGSQTRPWWWTGKLTRIKEFWKFAALGSVDGQKQVRAGGGMEGQSGVTTAPRNK